MTGIREEKKKAIREKLLNSAKEVFLDQGYAQTTIEHIAKHAELGLGTAYNYFSSKEELFLLAMAEEFTAPIDENIPAEQYQEIDVAGIVLEQLLRVLRKMNFFSKKIWREVFTALIKTMNSNMAVIKTLMKADYQAMDRIRALLNKLKAKKLLEDSFLVDEAVELIYGALVFQLMWYLFEDNITYEQLTGKLQAQLKFLFEDKCKKIIR